MLQSSPQYINWAEDSGKNALHYLCAITVHDDVQKTKTSLDILKFLLEKGMDMNSIHQIPDGCGNFPATPVWYAYTRGRNEALFTYLLANGAKPDNCMFAIAWYNDLKAAALFKKHGASIDDGTIGETPFMSAFCWKRFEIAEWFLANGADVNFADKKGNTALFYAVKRKYNTKQISLLLQHGADVNKPNNDAISPKQLATSNHQKKILALFGATNSKP